jgi:hypothetical protein
MRLLYARLAGGAFSLALGLALSAPALAVGVTVNGQAITLSPPPIERAGRVFVPLRGVFQQLGASVVYEGGVINATGNGNTISLHIGSTQATVNGNAQALDVAPFIVGASTYVPLRFVSQALGAGVNYDGTNQIVALTTGGGRPPGPPQPGGNIAPPSVAHVLREEQPARDSTVRATRPTIQGAFAQPVDPNSVRLTLDGLDITRDATRSVSGFVYAPPSPLQSDRHVVTIVGHLATGEPFADRFTFTSGTEAPQNSVSIASPRDGEPVGQNFTIAGHTAPNARIHIVAGASAGVGGFAFGTGSYVGDTIADGGGNFSQQVTLQTIGGSTIGVTVISTDPLTRESAEKKLQLQAR